jgi:RNA polymerase sigma-70 factor (ECF subfamily)
MSKKGFGKTLSEFDFVALKKGKHNGFNAAYHLYADHVYSLARHIVGNEQTAADLLQVVFETLLKKAAKLQDVNTLGPWLKQCTVNACMGYFRKIKQENLFIKNSIPGNSEEFESIDTNEDSLTPSQVTDMLNKLPSTSRSVVYLHTVQGLKHSEIAPSLGINESNSRQLYSRALKQMKTWFNKV